MVDIQRRDGTTGPDTPARRSYEPPRLEELGTIEELTMGSMNPTAPDDSTFFGSVPLGSDRRLKDGVAPVDSHRVLERVSAARARRQGYEAPRLEELGTIEELTMGLTIPGTPDNVSSFGSGGVVSDRRLKAAVYPVDPRLMLDRVSAARTPRR